MKVSVSKIRDQRVIHEVERKVVADVLGISTSAYNKLENDPRVITFGQAFKLAKFYRCSITDFVA